MTLAAAIGGSLEPVFYADSVVTECFLQRHPNFKILFQPAYHPRFNRIELIWKPLHDVVTRNHKFMTMKQLMTAVHQFYRAGVSVPGQPGCNHQGIG